MKRALAYLLNKRYEILLAIIFGLFLSLQRFSLQVLLSVWFIGVFVLFIYDLECTKAFVQKGIWAVKSYHLEALLFIIIICISALWSFPLKPTGIALFACALFILGIHPNIVSRGIKKGMKDIKSNPLLGILLVVSSVLFFIWNTSVMSTLLFVAFFSFLFFQWENRVFAVFALFCLASCPILLSLKQDAMAEIMAQYAYFFLVMTVVLQIVEYKRHPERTQEDGD